MKVLFRLLVKQVFALIRQFQKVLIAILCRYFSEAVLVRGGCFCDIISRISRSPPCHQLCSTLNTGNSHTATPKLMFMGTHKHKHSLRLGDGCNSNLQYMPLCYSVTVHHRFPTGKLRYYTVGNTGLKSQSFLVDIDCSMIEEEDNGL